MTTTVKITIKRDDTYEVLSDADFFLYKLDEKGNEVSYTHYYLSGAKAIILNKNPGERYHVRFVNSPSLEIEEPGNGIYATFMVSTSSTQNVEVLVTPKKEKPKYHLNTINLSFTKVI